MIPPSFQFRPNTCDENVFRSVVLNNEYRLPDRFGPSDLILDIGGHIGSFVHACEMRGAGTIVTFEPDLENFRRLCENLRLDFRGEPLAGVETWGRRDEKVSIVACRGAVTDHAGTVRFTGPLYDAEAGEVNTGGGTVSEEGGLEVPAVDFMALVFEILNHFRPVNSKIALLKLDCEGGEWAILHQMFMGARSDAILSLCGEYHGGDGAKGQRDDIHIYLSGDHNGTGGYREITTRELRPGLGLFWAGDGSFR